MVMYFKQFYLGCLAHASYLLGSEGVAAVVDPQRDTEQYLLECAAQGLEIKYVIETHLHADFVSGHCELAARTGAEIVFSHHAQANFPHRKITDGDEIKLGRVTLRFWETPGHTPESLSILVVDHEVSDEPQKVLTGDTLFNGDVGRPDLAGGRGYTAEAMAAMLYDSLHGKLLTLDDAVEVFPAHGVGSMCGRNISKETSTTIGQQRKLNYALRPMPKDEFVRLLTTDMPAAPAYFSRDAELNRTGASPLEKLPLPLALTPAEVKADMERGALVLDVRAAEEYGCKHLPGALNIGLGGQFATWAGSLIAPDAQLVLVAADDRQIEEAVMRLARVGLENVRGYLRSGMLAWEEAGYPTASVSQITVAELHRCMAEDEELQVVDVRRAGEYRAGHVPRARLVQLSELQGDALDGLDPSAMVAVICAGGYRSSAATSILERRGFQYLHNVTGGTAAYISAHYPVEKMET